MAIACNRKEDRTIGGGTTRAKAAPVLIQSRQLTENMQIALTMDLPHSSRRERMDSQDGRLIRLRCLSRPVRGSFTLRGTAHRGRFELWNRIELLERD